MIWTIALGALALPGALAFSSFLELCPQSCDVTSLTTSKWSAYGDVEALTLCDQPMLVNFLIDSPIDDPKRYSMIRACNANSTTSVATCPAGKETTAKVQTVAGDFGKHASKVSKAATEVAAHIGSGCNTTVSMAYFDGASVGVYAGSNMLTQGVDKLIKTFKEGSSLMQVCGEGADNVLGIVANVEGGVAGLASVQKVLNDWSQGKCANMSDATESTISIWKTPKSRFMPRSKKLKPRADGVCESYLVQAEDSCWKIADARKPLTQDDIEAYNKNTWGFQGCKNLFADMYICLSEGSPPMPLEITNAICGPQKPGTKEPPAGTDLADMNQCPIKACCNMWGQCGTTSDFCEITDEGAAPGTQGCISNCGEKIVNNGSPPASFIKLGYFESFGMNRPCLQMDVSKIDSLDYTHVHYAFANITPGFEVDVGDQPTQFKRFLKLKSAKRIVSFGGWAFSTEPGSFPIFREGVTPAERTKFANNVADFVKSQGLDGVDFDWEYPGAPDIPGIPPGGPNDGANYLSFLKEVRALLPTQSVSIAAPASYWYLKAFPIAEMADVVDYIVYMTYDLHGQWDYGSKFAQVGCLGGDCLRSHINKTETINSLTMITKAGVEASKILVGVSSYGRSFGMTDPSCTGPLCTYVGPESGASPGECTGTNGYISNAELDKLGVTKNYDEVSDSNWGVYDGTWVSWMDDDIKKSRTDFYRGLNFGGTIDWAIDLQSFDLSDGSGGGGDDDDDDDDVDGGPVVYMPPDIWAVEKPTVGCDAPCTFILPPFVLETPITINWPPFTTSFHSLKDDKTVTKTSVITIKPVTTTVVSFWTVRVSADPPKTAIITPSQSVMPPEVVITLASNEASIIKTVNDDDETTILPPIFFPTPHPVTIQPHPTIRATFPTTVRWSSVDNPKYTGPTPTEHESTSSVRHLTWSSEETGFPGCDDCDGDISCPFGCPAAIPCGPFGCGGGCDITQCCGIHSLFGCSPGTGPPGGGGGGGGGGSDPNDPDDSNDEDCEEKEIPMCTSYIKEFTTVMQESTKTETSTISTCTSLTVCEGDGSTSTTSTNTATTSLPMCAPTGCNGNICGNNKRDLPLPMPTAAIEKREDDPPIFLQGPESFDPAYVRLWVMTEEEKDNNLKTPHSPDGTSSLYSLFGRQYVSQSIDGLYGCTSVIIVSRKGVYMSHIWQNPSFMTDDGQQVTDTVFRNLALGPLLLGNSATTPMMDMRPLLAAEFNPQIIIVTPSNYQGIANGVGLYPDHVNEINAWVRGVVGELSVPVKREYYTIPMGASGESTLHSGAILQYAPMNTFTYIEGGPCTTLMYAGYRLWGGGTQNVLLAQDDWVTYLDQVPAFPPTAANRRRQAACELPRPDSVPSDTTRNPPINADVIGNTDTLPPFVWDPKDPPKPTQPGSPPETTDAPEDPDDPDDPEDPDEDEPYSGTGCATYTATATCDDCPTQTLCVPTKPCVYSYEPSGKPECTDDAFPLCLATTIITRCAKIAERTAAPEPTAVALLSEAKPTELAVVPEVAALPEAELVAYEPDMQSSNPSLPALLFPRAEDCGGSANGGCDYLIFCKLCARREKVPCLRAEIFAFTKPLEETEIRATVWEDDVKVCEAKISCPFWDDDCNGITDFDCGDGNKMGWRWNYIQYTSDKYGAKFPMYLERTVTDKLVFCLVKVLGIRTAPAACIEDWFAHEDGPCQSTKRGVVEIEEGWSNYAIG